MLFLWKKRTAFCQRWKHNFKPGPSGVRIVKPAANHGPVGCMRNAMMCSSTSKINHNVQTMAPAWLHDITRVWSLVTDLWFEWVISHLPFPLSLQLHKGAHYPSDSLQLSTSAAPQQLSHHPSDYCWEKAELAWNWISSPSMWPFLERVEITDHEE